MADPPNDQDSDVEAPSKPRGGMKSSRRAPAPSPIDTSQGFENGPHSAPAILDPSSVPTQAEPQGQTRGQATGIARGAVRSPTQDRIDDIVRGYPVFQQTPRGRIDSPVPFQPGRLYHGSTPVPQHGRIAPTVTITPRPAPPTPFYPQTPVGPRDQAQFPRLPPPGPRAWPGFSPGSRHQAPYQSHQGHGQNHLAPGPNYQHYQDYKNFRGYQGYQGYQGRQGYQNLSPRYPGHDLGRAQIPPPPGFQQAHQQAPQQVHQQAPQQAHQQAHQQAPPRGIPQGIPRAASRANPQAVQLMTQQEIIERNREMMERARGFDESDDEEFIPNIRD